MFLMASLSALGIKYAYHEEKKTKNNINLLFRGVEIINGLLFGMNEEGSGLTVLRTFRLFRILKLVRFFPGLQRQLVVMLRTMDNVVVFFGLLSLFIFIFRQGHIICSVGGVMQQFLVSLACNCLAACSVTQILAFVTGRTLILSCGQLSQCSKYDFNVSI